MTLRESIHRLLAEAFREEFPEAGDLQFEVSKPREPAHGDFASNIAMLAAKVVRKKPMEVAERIAGRMSVPSNLIASVETKPPGFINIFMSGRALLDKMSEITTCDDDEAYGFADVGEGCLVQVEFVSANPTGPLNVVSARAAAVGDSLVRLLRRTGYDARSEFYVNDSGSQVEHLGESLKVRFRQQMGETAELPDAGYPGEYLIRIAGRVMELAGWADRAVETGALLPHDVEVERKAVADFIAQEASCGPGTGDEVVACLQAYLEFKAGLEARDRPVWAPLYVCKLSADGLAFTHMMEHLVWLDRYLSFLKVSHETEGGDGKPHVPACRLFLGEGSDPVRGFDFARFAVEEIVAGQHASLGRFGKRPEGGLVFDTWFRESSLRGDVSQVLDSLVSDGRFITEKEGAVWLKGGEDEEEDAWVIRRSSGQPTYFLSDIAYHVNKRRRGFEKVIDIWGPDHHGHVARMHTAMGVISEVLEDVGIPQGWLEILIAQQVNLIREGERVVMSKRAGEYVTLDDVVEEVGADVARFFFLMRRCNSHLDFDLDLAKQTSEENPVYYVQYAHARICSVLEFGRENGHNRIPSKTADLTLLSSDEELDVIRALCEFDDLIKASAASLEPHRLTTYLIELAGKYHRFYHNHRVVTDDHPLTEARLSLCYAVRTVIRSALWLLGVSAPTTM
jgi:arginyl-tRNA synthetase